MDDGAAMLSSMVHQPSPAEELPALYRAALDGVAALERRGQRVVAAAIRREAIAAYSAAWDDHNRIVLAGLVERTRRELARGSAATPGIVLDRRPAVLAPPDR
jgi:hypothetical protein